MDSDSLEQQLQRAHERGDVEVLSTLYGEAANELEVSGDIGAACFYLTQAYIFALDAGLASAADYNARLVAHGRDELLPALRGI